MNDDYQEYLQKYCEKHGISQEEAENHCIVQAYKEYLEEEKN